MENGFNNDPMSAPRYMEIPTVMRAALITVPAEFDIA